MRKRRGREGLYVLEIREDGRWKPHGWFPWPLPAWQEKTWLATQGVKARVMAPAGRHGRAEVGFAPGGLF